MTDARQSVLTWLQKHGYPFELRVAREFRRSGWGVEHATWFRDVETGKFRELDLVAIISAVPVDGRNEIASIRLAIECKRSDNPWVLFASELPPKPFVYSGVASRDPLSSAAMFIALAKQIALPSVLQAPEDYAHGVVKAHSDNKQGDPTAPYSAIRSVLNAANAIGEKQADFALSAAKVYPTVGVVVPVVVLAGTLYRYAIDQSDNDLLEQTNRAVVAMASPIDGSLAPVHLVTEAGLRDFVSSITDDSHGFAEQLLVHQSDILMMMQSAALRRAESRQPSNDR
jgi:hypothetical protein